MAEYTYPTALTGYEEDIVIDATFLSVEPYECNHWSHGGTPSTDPTDCVLHVVTDAEAGCGN